MKIYFLFVRNTKPWAILSPVFEYIDGVDFSHCEIGIANLDQQEDQATIYGAEFPVSRKINFKTWSETYQIKHMVSVTESDPIRILAMNQWLESKLKKPYRIIQLFMIAANKLSRGWLTRNYRGKLYGFVCTEFLGEFMIEFYKADFHKDKELIDLGDALAKAKEIGEQT